jgi:hypothetical protein
VLVLEELGGGRATFEACTGTDSALEELELDAGSPPPTTAPAIVDEGLAPGKGSTPKREQSCTFDMSTLHASSSSITTRTILWGKIAWTTPRRPA